MSKLNFVIALGILAFAVSTTAVAAERPKGSNITPRSEGSTAITVQPAGLTELLQCLVGPSVQVSNATLIAAPNAAGTFSGGGGIVGIPQGIVLSSGSIATLVGPNLADDASVNNELPGDADLNTLTSGFPTFDATVLEFDFRCENTTTVTFQYVFASEEYNEFVASKYNDVFGFFLNGNNIAIVPAVCSNGGIPVTINNVNCQNPHNPPFGSNCDCYRNNDLDDGGGGINTEMDGLTQVFFATGVILPGLNHMKIAIADASDFVLDSNVMIACQSFECGAPPATGACCIEDDCFLLTSAQCHAQGGQYQGDGVACSPNLCNPVPAPNTSWGKMKDYYR